MRQGGSLGENLRACDKASMGVIGLLIVAFVTGGVITYSQVGRNTDAIRDMRDLPEQIAGLTEVIKGLQYNQNRILDRQEKLDDRLREMPR